MFKRPESILVVIHTMSGEVLRLLRHEPAGFWQSVTGSLLENETPLKAALREVREETGLDAGMDLTDSGIVNRYPTHPAWRHRYSPQVRENIEYVFSLLLPERVAVTLAPAEHAEYRWLPRTKAAELAASHTDRDAILTLVPPASPEA
ncbi:MAG TPA: dihydroneopterin triphosphate diphosphatase [Gammaproteobacteria bacterium]|nr:dihydroneopterin triphosphate diphosphatase [Gammaproteobacteria bacterium]